MAKISVHRLYSLYLMPILILGSALYFNRYQSSKLDRTRSIESRYTSLSGFDFMQYFEWFHYGIPEDQESEFIKTCKTNLIYSQKINTNNYLEIGTGPGYVVSAMAPFFDNITIIEPNPFFRQESQYMLQNYTKHVQYVDILIDDILELDIDKADSLFLENEKFDLIVMQHVLWSVQLELWEPILDTLYHKFLAWTDSAMIVTLLSATDTIANIHRHFLPEIRMVDYVENFCKSRLLTCDIWKDTAVQTVSESQGIDILLDLLRVNYALYDNTIVDQNKDDMILVIQEYLRQDGLYSVHTDNDTGKEIKMITIEINNVHVVFSK